MSALFGDFRCPRCGSPYFGTNHARGRRYCKGHMIAAAVAGCVATTYRGCSFEWDPADDAKYCSDEDPTDPTLPLLPEDDLADSERGKCADCGAEIWSPVDSLDTEPAHRSFCDEFCEQGFMAELAEECRP